MRRLALGVLAALMGCAGSQVSRGGGAGGATDGGVTGDGAVAQQVGPCLETPSVVAPDQVTPLGFSAKDVLAATGGGHTIDLAWIPETLYATHARAGGKVAFALTFAATPSEVRFIDSKGGGCPDRGAGDEGLGAPCIVCLSRLEVDVGLHMLSGDGALDEQLTVTLKAISPSGPRFRAELPAADVKGGYLAGITPRAGYRLSGVYVEAGFGVPFPGSRADVPDEWNGFVAAQLLQGSSTGPVLQAHGYFPSRTAGPLVP